MKQLHGQKQFCRVQCGPATTTWLVLHSRPRELLGNFHSPQRFLEVPPGSYSHSCTLPRHTVDTGNFDVNHNLSQENIAKVWLTRVVDKAVTCSFLRLSGQVLQHPALSIAPCQKGTTQPKCVFCKGHCHQTVTQQSSNTH